MKTFFKILFYISLLLFDMWCVIVSSFHSVGKELGEGYLYWYDQYYISYPKGYGFPAIPSIIKDYNYNDTFVVASQHREIKVTDKTLFDYWILNKVEDKLYGPYDYDSYDSVRVSLGCNVKLLE